MRANLPKLHIRVERALEGFVRRYGIGSSQHQVLCFGEVSWDITEYYDRLPQNGESCHPVFTGEGPGGCALNTACALARLGSGVTLSGNPIGRDRQGSLIIQHLEKLAVREFLVRREDLPTPGCRCLVEQTSGERAFLTAHEKIQVVDETHLDLLSREVREGRFPHAFVQPYIKEMSRRFLHAIQGAPIWILTQDLKVESEFIERSDALQLSLEDVGAAFQADPLRDFVTPFWRGRLQDIFITAGELGVAHVRRSGAIQFHAAIRADTVVDTTGCGDAFRAGLLRARSFGAPIEEAIEFGQLVGAWKAGLRGSNL